MGSFVTLDLYCLSSLMESCHNCSSGKVARVSISESLAVRIETKVIRPITFLCCGMILNAEGAIFWHSDEITSDSISNHTPILNKDQELQPVENDVVAQRRKEEKNAIENVIVKCEEKTIMEKVDNEEDSVKILVEEDPLLLDPSSSTTLINKSSLITKSYSRHSEESENLISNSIRKNLIGILTHQDAGESVANENAKGTHSSPRKRKYPDSFTCEFCGRIFTGKNRAYLFYYHRNKEHTQAMVFRCDICLKDFYGDRELLSHMTTHKDPGHVCHLCGQKLSSSKHLKTHLLIHETSKQYTCEFCDKTFRRKDHLRVHKRIHTGERPYQCKLCGSAYPQKHQLKLHLKKCSNM
ncbi:hypothetical protein SK128_014875 [Halocaridina rubra]|uniref:C2H2-type domain-containing protein n=1 Tax=Halocaridina rubra TaxID=373956 RepID=A0AAN9AAH8_HALRR